MATPAVTRPDDQPSTMDRARTLAGKLGVYMALAQTCWAFYQRARSWQKHRTTHVVTVREGDELFDVVDEWLAAATPEGDRRRLLAQADCHSYRDDVPTRVRVAYDDTRTQVLAIGGHDVHVSKERPEPVTSLTSVTAAVAQAERIEFVTRSVEAQQAVIDHLVGLLAMKGRRARVPAVHAIGQHGGFRVLAGIPPRPLSSVVLAAGQLERIVADLEDFLAREEWYLARGLPYHRGLMLDGPPGTGKTTVAKVVAAHLGLDLFVLNLGDLREDTKLAGIVSGIPARSVLLLEDVDSFKAATDRQNSGGGLSMSGLLNALDGVTTPHGLITVMTTNHPEVLDPAVVRPGRMDRVEHLGLPDAEQLGRLFQVFYGVPSPLGDLDGRGRTPAEVYEVFKRHEDPLAGALALIEEERVPLPPPPPGTHDIAVDEDLLTVMTAPSPGPF